LSIAITLRSAPERDFSGPGSFFCSYAQHLRICVVPRLLSASRVTLGAKQLTTEVCEAGCRMRSSYAEPAVRSDFRIDHDVDAAAITVAEPSSVSSCRSARTEPVSSSPCAIERLGEHEPDRRGLEHRTERRRIAGSPPLTAISVGAAARGRFVSVVNVTSAADGGMLLRVGRERLRTKQLVGRARRARRIELHALAVADDLGHRIDGTIRSDEQNDPSHSPPVRVHEPKRALRHLVGENVTTMREPSGTSRWPSIGNVNTTPGSAVASGATDESHALRNAATTPHV